MPVLRGRGRVRDLRRHRLRRHVPEVPLRHVDRETRRRRTGRGGVEPTREAHVPTGCCGRWRWRVGSLLLGVWLQIRRAAWKARGVRTHGRATRHYAAILPVLRREGGGRMSEETIWAVAWLVVGFCVGFLVCYLICERRAEKRFEEGFRLGRAFDGFDDWFRENYGDRHAD